MTKLWPWTADCFWCCFLRTTVCNSQSWHNETHFTEIGMRIWQWASDDDTRYVTIPCRPYVIVLTRDTPSLLAINSGKICLVYASSISPIIVSYIRLSCLIYRLIGSQMADIWFKNKKHVTDKRTNMKIL